MSSVGFREGLDVAGRGDGRGREQESSGHGYGTRARERERASEHGAERKRKSFVTFACPRVPKGKLFCRNTLQTNRKGNKRTLSFSLFARGMCSLCSAAASYAYAVACRRCSVRRKDRREKLSEGDHHRRRSSSSTTTTTLGLHQLDLRLALPSFAPFFNSHSLLGH